MEKLKKGDLDAVIVVGGKPYVSVTTFNNDGRFHLAAVDYSKPLQSDYLPAKLTSKDYPNLIPEGETVETIAVPSVLAAYNWAPNTERRRKLALFVDAFFTKFAALQNPPFHPKWKEVSLPAPLAGWNRLPLAQQWLNRSEEHTSELQSLRHLVCRLLLEKKKHVSTSSGHLRRRAATSRC